MNAVVKVGMTLNYVIDSSCSKYKDRPAIGMAMKEPLSYGDFQECIFALFYIRIIRLAKLRYA